MTGRRAVRPSRWSTGTVAGAVAGAVAAAAIASAPAPASAERVTTSGDAPIEEELFRDRLDDDPIERNGIVLATTGETRIVRVGDRVRSSTAMTTTATETSTGTADSLVTSVEVDVPLCPDETGRFDGTIEYVLRSTSTGTATPSRFSVVGEVVGQMNDDARLATISLPQLDIEIRTDIDRDPDLVISASSSEFREAFDATATGEIVSNSGAVTADPNDLLSYAVVVAGGYATATLEFVAKAAGEGECVRLELDGRGITTIGPGVTAPLDVRVVEVASGATLELPVDASTIDGEVTPDDRVPSPVELEFTASSAQQTQYTVSVSTRSRRGADAEQFTWSTGWVFDGAVLTQQFDGFSGVSTWSGFVCGDPLTTPWTFTQTVQGPGLSQSNTFTIVPFAVGGPRPDIGTVPMIEPSRVQATADAPPFRLYLDDIAPEEATPATQRIPVTVRPATTECTTPAS